MSQATAELVRRELGPVEITPIAAAPGYWKAVGQRLMRDPVTIAVTVILLGIIFISIAAPLVAGADPYAGSVLARLKPIPQTDRFELFYWSLVRERWRTFGDFGRLRLTLDRAYEIFRNEPIFRIQPAR